MTFWKEREREREKLGGGCVKRRGGPRQKWGKTKTNFVMRKTQCNNLVVWTMQNCHYEEYFLGQREAVIGWPLSQNYAIRCRKRNPFVFNWGTLKIFLKRVPRLILTWWNESDEKANWSFLISLPLQWNKNSMW